jgi:hypothetical protein
MSMRSADNCRHNPTDQEGEVLQEQARKLLTATQALLAYIDDNQVYDKMADAGCGLYDTYRSDSFNEAISQARAAVEEMEKVLTEAA